MLYPLILCGGAGTRLWPLSNDARPKQFLNLTGDRSLLEETIIRSQGLGTQTGGPIMVCNTAHHDLVAAQCSSAGRAPLAIILEPEGRNTAPAVALGALEALREDPDALLMVMPADHDIANVAELSRATELAQHAAQEGFLVTFGIVPQHAETGYGYIQVGESLGGHSKVERFVEKPDLATAEGYLASGDYLWNSGMFLLSAHGYIEELRRLEPKMVTACEQAMASAARAGTKVEPGSSFLDCRKDSIDYAVMERADRVAVVPLDAGWNDVGSWDAVHEISARDGANNVTRGDVVALDASGNLVISSGRTVALVGVENLVVIETEDAVLVLPRGRTQEVKAVVEHLKARTRD